MCDWAETSAVQSTTTDNSPQWLKSFYENLAKENTNVYNTAKNIYNSNSQYQPYTGARVQQFSNDQLSGMQRVRDSMGVGQDALAGATQSIGLGSRSMSDTMPLNASTVSSAYEALLGRTPSAQEINHQLSSGVKSMADLQGVLGNSAEAQQKMAAGFKPDMSKLQDGSFRPTSVQTENYNQSYQQGGVTPQYMTAVTNTGKAPLIGTDQSAQQGNFNTAAAQQYMNPYTDTVIKNTLGEMDRQNSMGISADGARASAAKAFGGSRQGIVDAERNRNFGKATGDMIANLQNQNYAQAQGQFNTQAGLNQQNNQFNAGMGQGAQLANQGAIMTTLMGDQAAINASNQFNGTMGVNAQLANEQMRQNAFGINRDTFNQNQDRQFATQVQNQNMGLQAYNANRDQFNTDQSRLLQGGALNLQNAAQQQQMRMQDNNNLLSIGGLQQQLGQQGLDVGYQDYLNQKQYPYQQFNFLQSALQGNSFNPYQGISGSSTTQKGGDASALQQIAGLGIAGVGAYMGF